MAFLQNKNKLWDTASHSMQQPWPRASGNSVALTCKVTRCSDHRKLPKKSFTSQDKQSAAKRKSSIQPSNYLATTHADSICPFQMLKADLLEIATAGFQTRTYNFPPLFT